MRVVLHLAGSKSKSRHLALAQTMATGIRAAGFKVSVLPRDAREADPTADMAVIYGLAGTASGLMEAYGSRVGFVDKAYFGRQFFLRFVPGSIHPQGDFRSADPAAFLRTGDTIRNSPHPGDAILLAGDSGKGSQFFGSEDARTAHVTAVEKLKEVVGSEALIVYRPKPSWRDGRPIEGTYFDNLERPIDSILNRAHAVVTWASNAAVDAIRWDRPTVLLGPGGALHGWLPTELSKVTLTARLDGTLRRELIYGLARYQWKLSDFARGETWLAIKEQQKHVRH